MLRSLFQALFGSFSRKAAQDAKRAEESALVKRLIEQAQAIADGSYITDGGNLPPPVIPERRKEKR